MKKDIFIIIIILIFSIIGKAQNATQPIKGIFFDGAEDHQSFEINSTYNGWDFIDGDRSSTYEFSDFSFPGMGYPMAYIIFNPSETTPPQTAPIANVDLMPHTGDKFFAFLGASEPPYRNNDWLISPLLSMPSKLTFWAKGAVQCYCSDKMRIAYSISGKEESDFIILSEKQVGNMEWYFFEFNIPKEAKYIAINYVSEDMFVFMIDDITIEQEETNFCPTVTNLTAMQQGNSILLEWTAAAENPTTYKIYNGTDEVASDTTTKYMFEDISIGEYTFGVEAWYEDDCTPKMVTVNIIVNDIEIKELNISEIISIFPNPTTGELTINNEQLIINNIEIFDIYGRKLSHISYPKSHISYLISHQHLPPASRYLFCENKY